MTLLEAAKAALSLYTERGWDDVGTRMPVMDALRAAIEEEEKGPPERMVAVAKLEAVFKAYEGVTLSKENSLIRSLRETYAERPLPVKTKAEELAEAVESAAKWFEAQFPSNGSPVKLHEAAAMLRERGRK